MLLNRFPRAIVVVSDDDDSDVTVDARARQSPRPCLRKKRIIETECDDVIEHKAIDEAEAEATRAREEYERQLESERVEQESLEEAAARRGNIEARRRRAADRKAELIMRAELEAEYQSVNSISPPSPLALASVPSAASEPATMLSNDSGPSVSSATFESGTAKHVGADDGGARGPRAHLPKDLSVPAPPDLTRKRKSSSSPSPPHSSLSRAPITNSQPAPSTSSTTLSPPSSVPPVTSSSWAAFSSRPSLVERTTASSSIVSTLSTATARVPTATKSRAANEPADPPAKKCNVTVPNAASSTVAGKSGAELRASQPSGPCPKPPRLGSERKNVVSAVTGKAGKATTKPNASKSNRPKPQLRLERETKAVSASGNKKMSMAPVASTAPVETKKPVEARAETKKEPVLAPERYHAAETETQDAVGSGRGTAARGGEGNGGSDSDDVKCDGRESKSELTRQLKTIDERMLQSRTQYGQWKLLFDAVVAGEYDVTRTNSAAAASYDAHVAANGRNASASAAELTELTELLRRIVQEEILLSDNAKKHLIATMAQTIREYKVLQAEHDVLSRRIKGKSQTVAIQKLQLAQKTLTEKDNTAKIADLERSMLTSEARMAELQAENVRLRGVIAQHERQEVVYLQRERELEASLERAQTQRNEYRRKWKATNLRYRERERLRTNWIPL